MEIQKSFSKSAFGGFKKEEVTQYIDEIINKSEEQISALKTENENAIAQTAELKTIIEEQYQKIVDITASRDELAKQNEEKANQINELQKNLKPFIDAKRDVDAILAAAKNQALELSERSKQQAFEATQKAKSILEEATENAHKLLDPAKLEAEKIIDSARKKAEEIVFLSRKQEKEQLEGIRTQIDETLLMSEENEKNTKLALEEAKLEAQKIIEEAKEKSEAEKTSYEQALKELELQRSKFLLYLDEVKGSVQAIQIMHFPKSSEIEAFQVLRQATTEAIKKKFSSVKQKIDRGSYFGN